MPWPLKDDFRPGEPLSAVTADWLNTVARVLNTLGVDGGTLDKTPVPSSATPWMLRIPAAPSAPTPSSSTPNPPSSSGSAGTSASYARGDHAHPAVPSVANTTHIDTSSNGAAVTTTWGVGSGTNIKLWRHRYFYDGTEGSEKIVGVKHYEIYNGVTGALIEVGEETEYTMHSPEEDPNA